MSERIEADAGVTPKQDESPATPAPGEPAKEGGSTDLAARALAAEAEAARLKDEHLRALAAAENARRRAAEDVAKAHKYGIETFAASLLAVRDSLEAALAVPSPTVESLKQGVEITARQLAGAFEKAALVEIAPSPGEKFDPHRHQALSQVASELPANTVATVVQKGYLLHERVIRPALVMVAVGSPKAPAEDTGTPSDTGSPAGPTPPTA